MNLQLQIAKIGYTSPRSVGFPCPNTTHPQPKIDPVDR